MLFVGLGNPGFQYEGTRHNVGFSVISSLAKSRGINFIHKERFNCDIASSFIGDKKVIFAKPMTYMNLSGFSISHVKEYYKIPLQNIVVIHDEIDLPLGKIKAKIGGGHAGHNGIKSIDNQIGNEYLRIRIGVGRPPENYNLSNWVLEKFSDDEKSIIDKLTNMLSVDLSTIIKRDIIEINKIFARDYGV